MIRTWSKRNKDFAVSHQLLLFFAFLASRWPPLIQTNMQSSAVASLPQWEVPPAVTHVGPEKTNRVKWRLYIYDIAGLTLTPDPWPCSVARGFTIWWLQEVELMDKGKVLDAFCILFCFLVLMMKFWFLLEDKRVNLNSSNAAVKLECWTEEPSHPGSAFCTFSSRVLSCLVRASLEQMVCWGATTVQTQRPSASWAEL